MNSVTRQAARDAAEYAKAKMMYGEGAGNRRKLIKETVDWNMRHIRGYQEAFDAAISRQNMMKLAKQAKRDHKIKYTAQFLGKNARAYIRGDWRAFSTPVLVVVGAGVILKYTGYDKVLWFHVKKRYHIVKRWVKAKYNLIVEWLRKKKAEAQLV